MIQVILCHEMRWTWDQLLDQPQWFINDLLAFLTVKREVENRKK